MDKKTIKVPRKILLALLLRCNGLFTTKVYLKLLFRLKMGRKLDLKAPQTFSEKLQWLKLYDRRPEYTTMVDKYAVKDYVANIIGSEYIIPTLGVWDKPEQIEWDKLPNKFVLKTTHGGGSVGVVICRDKSTFDRQMAISRLNQSLKQDIYKYYKEWPYKNVRKRIFAEQYIEPRPNVQDLPDFKWYCFNGIPRYCQVIQDRNTKETIDFFDTEWNHQDFVGLNPIAGPASQPAMRPTDLETQIYIAKQLSEGIPFSRIDLYSLGDKTYFGEITFYPMSGFGAFNPDNYNIIIGQMLTLRGVKRGGVVYKVQSNNSIRVSQPELPDYKFFCVDGAVKALFVATDRQTSGVDVKFDFFDKDYNHLPFRQGHDNADVTPKKPKSFEEMKLLASLLSKGIPQVRIDFYENNGKPLFGEMTFFHFAALTPFEPEEWDYTFGSWIELPG